MQNEINEKDWKLFRERLPKWQERYMARLVAEYSEILNQDAKGSDRFWELEERINSDKKKVGVVAEMSRSLMAKNIASLMMEGAITYDDLDGFSEELVGRLHSQLDVYQ